MKLFTRCNAAGSCQCPILSASPRTRHDLWVYGAPEACKIRKSLLLSQFTRKHSNEKDPFERKKDCHLVLYWAITRGDNIPCNFSSSLGLLSNLRQLPVAVLVIEDAGSLRWLKTVKSPLSKSPLGFSLLFAVIFLGCKCGLLHRQNRAKRN